MGAVYKAEDTEIGDRLVAVKEMSQSNLDPQQIMETTEAFKCEAHLLGKLLHRHLPRIYEYFSEGGRCYLVMDYIEGETLEKYLAKMGGKLPVQEVLAVGIQLCTVLDYLHSQQPPIIFRDLKPLNVMRMANGDVFLIDFGIARHFKPGQAKDTVAYGSMGYSPPEQWGKTQTTPQSDIYSLGATLHQLLTGLDPLLSPFRFAQLSGTTIPTRLTTLIAQMVETDAGKRPASTKDILQELQRVQQQASQPSGVQLAPTQYTGSSSLPPTQLAVPTILQKTKEQWNDEGLKHLSALRLQAALQAFEQAIHLAPDNPDYHYNRGVVLYKLRRYQEALYAYEQAINLDYNVASYYYGEGCVLYFLNMYQEALFAYEQAISLDPNCADYYSAKGVALEALRRYRKALFAYEQAISLDTSRALFYHNKGNALRKLGRLVEAQQAYRAAEELGYSNQLGRTFHI